VMEVTEVRRTVPKEKPRTPSMVIEDVEAAGVLVMSIVKQS